MKRARPTIGLACIMKNELKNLPRFLESNAGCFDNIYLTDTGSTDGSIEWVKGNAEKIAKCPVHLSHFKWVNDFSKARNFAFSQVKDDYVAWEDLDDVLSDKDAFIKWRDYAMEFKEFWFATYNYALDKDGKPIVSFVRERVFKKTINPTWRYPLHEGIEIKPGWQAEYAIPWTVNHLRTAEDMAQDKNRNLSILDKLEDKDARLTFYHGKELYEADQPQRALDVLEKAVTMEGLAIHDKLLAFQYGAYAATKCADQLKDEFVAQKHDLYRRAIKLCNEGIAIDPNRAELQVGAGDAFIKMNNLKDAIPYYAAAKHCNSNAGSPYEGAIYSFVNCYGELPGMQLAKIYFTLGKMDDAKKEAQECYDKYKTEECLVILKEIEKISALVNIDNNQEETSDIVFTCPPQAAYPFDERLYKEKGMGGSETALIEMSAWLKKLTNRKVIVFNARDDEFIGESGVEWRSTKTVNQYFSKNKPYVHIAWRHNIEVTRAKTYLWCHDLVTPTVEGKKNFDKILCLTEFHKNYVMAKQGVPEEKIVITRNGINPEKFNIERKPKNPNKLVWMSSPDRGLDRAMLVCDEVRKTFPDIELHVYYGLDNLHKYGLSQLANILENMMRERPYVKYHGFTEQRKMYSEVSDAVIWCHPCNFIETSCITAMEMLGLGIYPVTHRLGGLQDTLKQAEIDGQATLLNHDCVTRPEIEAYSREVVKVLEGKLWEKVSLDFNAHSWESVAKSWVRMMEL